MALQDNIQSLLLTNTNYRIGRTCRLVKEERACYFSDLERLINQDAQASTDEFRHFKEHCSMYPRIIMENGRSTMFKASLALSALLIGTVSSYYFVPVEAIIPITVVGIGSSIGVMRWNNTQFSKQKQILENYLAAIQAPQSSWVSAIQSNAGEIKERLSQYRQAS